MTRFVLVGIVGMLLVSAGCEELGGTTPEPVPEPPPPSPPPPPPRPAAWTCVTDLQSFLNRYQNRMVYDVRYQNECDESVRIRLSSALYLSPSLARVDTDRREVVIPSGRSDWLCGNGQDFTACVFIHHDQDRTSGYRWRSSQRVCYLDQDCSWRPFPD